MAAPIAAAVGASNIMASSAVLVGSVNPQGISGTWWFAYGTTTSLGSTTTVEAIGASSIPQTVTAALAGLTAGTLYYFAAVVDTSGGTVTSVSLSFTAGAQPVVTNANQPIVSSVTPAVAIPHFAWPFTITSQGANIVEQDSYQEVLSCVQAIAACEVGECPELPSFGIPDLTFLAGPPATDGLVNAIQRLEPRAQETTIVQALDSSGGTWGVDLTTQVTGTGQ